MGWGFDWGDVADLATDIGETIYDAGAELIENVELSDILAVGTVGASIYFQNEQIEQQEKAMKAAQKQVQESMSEDPVSLSATPEAEDAITVDVGESDIVTEEDYEDSLEEADSNVGKIKKDKKKPNSASPKKERKKLLVPQKSGVQL